MQQLATASSVPAAILPAADQSTREATLARGKTVILDLKELRVNRSRSKEDMDRTDECYKFLNKEFSIHRNEVTCLLVGGASETAIKSFLDRKLKDKETEA